MNNGEEMRRASWSSLYYRIRRSCLPARVRTWVFNRILSQEGGVYYSYTLREILEREFDIELGSYSYGPIYDMMGFPRLTRIGRYCSIRSGVRI